MGRPALSPEQHALKGTRPTRAKPEPESSIVSGRPRAPKHLSAEALTAWRDAVRLMRKRGSLTPGDSPTLAVYAETVAQWVKAKADVEARGQILTEQRFSKSGAQYTVEVLNPSVRIQQDASRQLLALAKSLGLSPDSREKIKTPKPKKAKQAAQPAIVAALLEFKRKRAEENGDDSETD